MAHISDRNMVGLSCTVTFCGVGIVQLHKVTDFLVFVIAVSSEVYQISYYYKTSDRDEDSDTGSSESDVDATVENSQRNPLKEIHFLHKIGRSNLR